MSVLQILMIFKSTIDFVKLIIREAVEKFKKKSGNKLRLSWAKLKLS